MWILYPCSFSQVDKLYFVTPVCPPPPRVYQVCFLFSVFIQSLLPLHSISDAHLNSCVASPGGAAGIISHTEVISAMCGHAESSLKFKTASESDGRMAGECEANAAWWLLNIFSLITNGNIELNRNEA